MNLEEWEFDPDDIPTVTNVDYIDKEEQERIIEKGKRFIKDKFRNVDFKKLGPIGLGKNPENKYQLVHFGIKGGEDRICKKDNSNLLKSFTDKFKQAFGPSSEELLAEENQEVREAEQRLIKSEKRTERKEKEGRSLSNSKN